MKHCILSFFAVLVFAFIELPAFSQTAKSDSRPNIIFILTDDQRWDAFGAAGNKIIQTPHIDAITQKGIQFRNAYVTTAICCVSRASILSGQYMSRHKIDDFAKTFTDSALQQTYPLQLRKSGYTTGFVGKFGVGAILPDKDLFDYWNASKEFDQQYYLKNANGELIHNTDSIGNSAIDFLNEFADSKKPFCLSISFKAPHELDGNPPTYPVQEKFAPLYNGAEIAEPVTADPKYWNSFPDFFRTDANIGRERWKPLFSTPALYQQTVKNYYRLISGVDEVVGKLMNKLRELKVNDNTIIIFMGDNGFSLGEHGLQGKWFGFEEAIRVPMLIYDPRNKKNRGLKDDHIVLNIDIAPTILAFAGIVPAPGIQGNNLMEIVNGKHTRKDFFYEHTFLGSPRLPKVEGVVSTGFKYMKYIEHDYEELYDVKNDPHETRNLVSDVKYSKALSRMRQRYSELKQNVK